MYELNIKQNNYEYDDTTVIEYFTFTNCLNGKNLHIVLFIHIVYS